VNVGQFFQDENGHWSSARLLSIGGFLSAVGFGVAELLGHGLSDHGWDAIMIALGGGSIGQAGPRIASYFGTSGAQPPPTEGSL
jgi:hypothetical protein